MTDQRERTPNPNIGSPDINDPDLENSEQDDSESQAQTVAEEALRRGDRPRESEGSTHGGHSNPAQIVPDDEQDLVDHMNDMDRSGRIDMGAFDGEPESMDDEDGSIPE